MSIDFTEKRTKPDICDPDPGPGPGDYSLADDLFKNSNAKLRAHPGTWRGPAGNVKSRVN